MCIRDRFMIVPMGISLYYSFCSYDILSPPVFTGLQNFKTMFADETFYKSIKVTFFLSLIHISSTGIPPRSRTSSMYLWRLTGYSLSASRWGSFWSLWPNWIRPVSYTNLDVYKRQSHACH